MRGVIKTILLKNASMRNLVNTIQNAGDYGIYIRKNNLHEGNYFISIVIGSNHTTIPVVLK
jgi:hypothetical protein